jgi:hypothetical protein
VTEQERDAILKASPRRASTRPAPDAHLEDIRANAFFGRPLPLRLRNFQTSVEDYFVTLQGPRPYVLRLREIDARQQEHEHDLEARWHQLAHDEPDAETFAQRWTETVEAIVFDEVNDLIDRHNRWYPVEAGLPMDPHTGDFVLLGGMDYRRAPLDATWVLERFPADVRRASAP